MMLLADDTGGGASWGWIALFGALATVIPVISMAIINAIKAKVDANRIARADALSEWKQVVDIQREDIKGLKIGLEKCRDDHENAKIEATELRGEVRHLQADIRRLQVLTQSEAPATVYAALVVAVFPEGKILDASPAVEPLLHWLPRDLRGKRVDMLIPARYKEAHTNAVARMMERTTTPWPERAIVGHAIMGDGTETPVTISLSGRLGKPGDWIITAEISRRRVLPVTEDQIENFVIDHGVTPNAKP